jgi:hypothetical protein
MSLPMFFSKRLLSVKTAYEGRRVLLSVRMLAKILLLTLLGVTVAKTCVQKTRSGDIYTIECDSVWGDQCAPETNCAEVVTEDCACQARKFKLLVAWRALLLEGISWHLCRQVPAYGAALGQYRGGHLRVPCPVLHLHPLLLSMCRARAQDSE